MLQLRWLQNTKPNQKVFVRTRETVPLGGSLRYILMWIVRNRHLPTSFPPRWRWSPATRCPPLPSSRGSAGEARSEVGMIQRTTSVKVRCGPADATVLCHTSHGEVKGEGVHLLRTHGALRGCCNCVYCCSREAQVSSWYFLKRCRGRRLQEMFRGCTVSGVRHFSQGYMDFSTCLNSYVVMSCAHYANKLNRCLSTNCSTLKPIVRVVFNISTSAKFSFTTGRMTLPTV